MKIIIDIDVELPQIKKFFFCLPLRAGLITWGIIQFILAIIYCAYIIVDIVNNRERPHDEVSNLAFVLVFIITLIIWIPLEAISSFFLSCGTRKNNGNYLEVSYHFFKLKFILYAALICISIPFRFLIHCHDCWSFFSTTLDGLMYWMFFYQPDVGILVCLLQLYLVLMINTMIVELGHEIKISTLWTRVIRDIKADCTLDDNDLIKDEDNQPETGSLTKDSEEGVKIEIGESDSKSIHE